MAFVQPDYDKIFASGAAVGEILNWPSLDYLRGWGYLGESEPPPMEFFNRLQNESDLKAQYLFEAGNIRKKSTLYKVGEIATTPNLSSKYWLVCTVEGTTGENEPTWSDIENTIITDGTCKWRITAKTSTGITVSEDEPENPIDNTLWLALQGSSEIAELKYRTLNKK